MRESNENSEKKSIKILEIYWQCLNQLKDGIIPRDFDCYASLFQQSLSDYDLPEREILLKVSKAGIEQKKYLLAQQTKDILEKEEDTRLSIIENFLKNQ